jgi:deoxyribonuclease-4
METKETKVLAGAHTSAAGGVFNALLEGQSIAATTIQFFTSNQKQWAGRPLSDETVDAWKRAKDTSGIEVTMSHDSYLINLGCPDEENLFKSRKAFKEEIERCHALDVTYLNFHPGAALKESREACLDKIVESLLELEGVVAKGKTRLLLEMTAGQGSSVGCTFEEVGYIIDRVKDRLPVGVCIDTCHIFVAGYDIRTPEGWETTLQSFDQAIGLSHLYAMHLNDSAKGLGSRVDRHSFLGQGMIGLPCFETVMRHPSLRHLPKYLETPGGPPQWIEELKLLRSYYDKGPSR